MYIYLWPTISIGGGESTSSYNLPTISPTSLKHTVKYIDGNQWTLSASKEYLKSSIAELCQNASSYGTV